MFDLKTKKDEKNWYLFVAATLIITGFILNYTYQPMFSAGNYAYNYFAVGDYTLGIFAAGKFSADIFSIGIFSASIFNLAIYSTGIFVIAYKKKLPKLFKQALEQDSTEENE